MEKELDCRGLQCPQPVIRLRKLLEEQKPCSLDILVDNAAALENVKRFLERSGYAASSTETASGQWRISAAKTGDAPAAPAHARPSGEKTLVLLTTETLGRGDDTLGAKLMETFLANLSELGPSLWRIILLNGAVKLTATPGGALDQLRKMQESGIGIFVCGTCLMHYGLMERKMVGETTNMMDVITSMALAQKIIRP